VDVRLRYGLEAEFLDGTRRVVHRGEAEIGDEPIGDFGRRQLDDQSWRRPDRVVLRWWLIRYSDANYSERPYDPVPLD